MDEYELYHHGIKGMKWGVRRFQNDDGSLTSAGKQRYEASNKELKTVAKKLNQTKTSGSAGDIMLKANLGRLYKEDHEAGENFTYKFLNDEFRQNYDDFAALYNKKYAQS